MPHKGRHRAFDDPILVPGGRQLIALHDREIARLHNLCFPCPCALICQNVASRLYYWGLQAMFKVSIARPSFTAGSKRKVRNAETNTFVANINVPL